jgi:hypothetical protein
MGKARVEITNHGCEGLEPSFFFSFGGSALSAGFDSVPSGLVVESSGVGCRLLSVGRPGAPSSAPGSAPVLDALALESRNNRAFTF